MAHCYGYERLSWIGKYNFVTVACIAIRFGLKHRTARAWAEWARKQGMLDRTQIEQRVTYHLSEKVQL